jgi:hypothetical protein
MTEMADLLGLTDESVATDEAAVTAEVTADNTVTEPVAPAETPAQMPAPEAEPEPTTTEAVPAATVAEPAPETVVTGPDMLDMIMGRITTVGEADKYLRICIYGPPGVRKTTFIADAPKPIMFELDTGGSKSLIRDPRLVNLQKLPFRSMVQFNGFLDYLVAGDPRLDQWDTFIIDTYNGLQAKDLASVGFRSNGEPNYQENTKNMNLITDKLKQVQKHVIVTCHVREDKEEATGRVYIKPDLSPKVLGAVIADFDIIGYMTIEEGGLWQLRLMRTDRITAKSRVNGLPDVITLADGQPNIMDIFNKYEAARTDAINSTATTATN